MKSSDTHRKLCSDTVDERTRGPHAAEGMVSGHKSWAKDKLMLWSKAVAMVTEVMTDPLLPAMMPARGIGRGELVVLLN